RDIKPEKVVELGFKAIVSDLDATLRRPFEDFLIPEFEEHIGELVEAVHGNFWIVSNSAGTFFYKEEGRRIAEKYNLQVVEHFFKKPWGVAAARAATGCRGEETIMIGDRIYTDIKYGHNLGAITVLVSPQEGSKDINIKSIKVKEKRELERIVNCTNQKPPRHPRYDPDLVVDINNLLPVWNYE
ncbi:HAD hydrolase-like protein, partial [Candidatus Woesearchaeota archaeon]|nr:HAD hydrolase-like protein [Candidatus Woesearchaeota archaeon]